MSEQKMDMAVVVDVIERAYGWTIDREGQLQGLTAGDMGYEETGIFLDAETKRIWNLGVEALDLEDKKKTMGRHVVCAAVLYKNGTMLVGPRHFDVVMQQQYRATGINLEEQDAVQGFIDQYGVFMDRYEALDVATKAGQLKRKTFPLDRLFSEDLY